MIHILLPFSAVFAKDGAYVSAILELPDISAENSTEFVKKFTKKIIFSVKTTSGNSETGCFSRGVENPAFQFINLEWDHGF